MVTVPMVLTVCNGSQKLYADVPPVPPFLCDEKDGSSVPPINAVKPPRPSAGDAYVCPSPKSWDNWDKYKEKITENLAEIGIDQGFYKFMAKEYSKDNLLQPEYFTRAMLKKYGIKGKSYQDRVEDCVKGMRFQVCKQVLIRDQVAIYLYTADKFSSDKETKKTNVDCPPLYRVLNKELRTERTVAKTRRHALSRYYHSLTEAIKKCPQCDFSIPLYRGERATAWNAFLNHFGQRKGFRSRTTQFLSCSKRKKEAKKYALFDRNDKTHERRLVKLVRSEGGSSGFDISLYSMFTTEEEVLILNDQQMEVVSNKTYYDEKKDLNYDYVVWRLSEIRKKLPPPDPRLGLRLQRAAKAATWRCPDCGGTQQEANGLCANDDCALDLGSD